MAPYSAIARWRHVAGTAAIACAAAVIIVVKVSGRGRTAWHEYATAAGQRESVTLSDGTRFTLAPASRLRVPADFGIRTRTVDLSGKAYFAVVHDPARPFAVHTAHAVVHDIGTTFVVHAYAGDLDERIAVAEGEVAVQGTHSEASHLRANGAVVVDARGRVVVQAHATVASDLAWLQGGLAFEDAPVRDVVRELARTFDLDIVVADSALLTQHVTASFGREPVDRILAAVALPLGARVERDGRHVVLRRGTVGAGQPAAPGGQAGEVFTVRVPRPMSDQALKQREGRL